ncbi:MAG: hypothetical protein R2745_25760 [Vicinamibacterales bacterium]
MTRAAVTAVVGVVAAVAAAPGPDARAAAQALAESRELRQLVTFRFLPGQTEPAVDLYRSQVVPIYRQADDIKTVRFLGEVESPEPLDLVVVTHYADMAAMDRANRALASRVDDPVPIGRLYRQLSDLSFGHHDQFVEVLTPPALAAVPDRMLDVLEFIRVAPGMGATFERMTLGAVHAWEQETSIRELVPRTETARFLIADGWDYLRTYAVADLAAWQAYTTARSRHPVTTSAARFVDARKTMVLREMPDLRVR